MNVLEESLDTMTRSCTKDRHKLHRTHWHFKNISWHQVTGCLTKTKNNKRLDLIMKCFKSIVHTLYRKELEEELLQCPRKGAEVN